MSTTNNELQTQRSDFGGTQRPKRNTRLANVKSKVDSWRKSPRPTTSRNTAKKHNFTKTTTALKTGRCSPTLRERSKDNKSRGQVPFYQKLKAFNEHQDSLLTSIKDSNLQASMQKQELDSAMMKIQEQYIEKKKSELLQKQIQIQDIKIKTIKLLEKKQSKVADIAKLEQKLEEAKKELSKITEITLEK
jgi:hypothetical protein